MNCPNCNKPLNPNQKFCDACGQRVTAEPASPSAPYNYAEPVRDVAQPSYPPEQPQPSAYDPEYPQQPNVSSPQPPKKSHLPMIIVIVVLAVLLVGGGIATAIILMNNKDDKKDDKSTSSGTTSSSVSSVSSAFSDPDSDTDTSDSSVGSSEIHRISTDKGVFLIQDDAIDTSDIAAEKKISDYLENHPEVANSMNNSANGAGSGDVYARGNALVYEFTITSDVTAEQKSMLSSYLNIMKSGMASSLSSARSDTGVSNMVMVVAYLEKDGTLIDSTIIK